MSEKIGKPRAICRSSCSLPSVLLGILLQRVADAKPCGNRVATLHPAEYPGNGAQVLKSTALGAACRAGPDACGIQFVDGSGLLEVLEDIGIFGDLAAIDAIGFLRHLFDRFFPARRAAWMVRCRSSECFEAGRDHQFQIPFGQHRISVFPVEDFALFGDADLAGETSRRLGEDGGVRGTAAAANRSAASVEQAKLYVEVPSLPDAVRGGLCKVPMCW